MQRIFDATREGLDVLYKDNNRLERLQWCDDEASSQESDRACWAGLAQMAELWLPERYTITVADVAYDAPGKNARTVTLETGAFLDRRMSDILADVEAGLHRHLDADGSQPWMLQNVDTSLAGWNRIAVPEGVRLEGEWVIVSPDGLAPQPYELHGAPPVGALATVWLRATQSMAATHVTLNQYAAGDLELRTSMGITFFQPGNDPRAPDYQVRGGPLRAWQEANATLYRRIFAALADAGWRSV